MVEPIGCQLDELWVTVDRSSRYLPNVVEFVDKMQLLACILRVTTSHSHFGIDLRGCRGGIEDHLCCCYHRRRI
jgi:hypothetical protein